VSPNPPRRPRIFGNKRAPQTPAAKTGKPVNPITLPTVVGDHARMEGKFDTADLIQVEGEVGGELSVGCGLVIGEKGVVMNADSTTNDFFYWGPSGIGICQARRGSKRQE
jgi:cytoskeletal protein CcmA (bactofilin family)